MAVTGRIIAVETSFDDAAVAVIDRDGTMIAGYTAGQVDLHSPWGGVVPEIAARSHLVDLPQLMYELGFSVGLDGIALVAATRGPGLIGSLLTGVNFARGVATGLKVPCIGLNHLEGHIFSPFIETIEPGESTRAEDESGKPAVWRKGRPLTEIPFPHLALVVSGGNTLLVRVDGLGEYEVCGETLDDAGGELLDKIAVALGRSYPGGATIERLARTCEPNTREVRAWLSANRLPVPMRDSGDLNFSYSGLKTAALRLIEKEGIKADHPLEPLFAYELQRVLVESIFIKVRAFTEANIDAPLLTVSGGVAANVALVASLRERLSARGIGLAAPALALAVDNAEMMAYLAWLYCSGFDPLPDDVTVFDAEAGLRL